MLFGPATGWAQSSETLRIATFAAPLSRDGPGLLLRDVLSGDDPQVRAILAIIDQVSPDILLLTDIDFDAGQTALRAFSDALADPYPYRFTARPNAGVQAGLDLDGDGFRGDARDALGYGEFLGDGGMGILSRHPLSQVTDLTAFLWKDLPDAVLPTKAGDPFPSAAAQQVMPLSSSNHWIVTVDVSGIPLSLLAFSATPPVFDGPEDANGLRNRDELRLWETVLDGGLGPVPLNPVVIGNSNLDPLDGDGLSGAMSAFVARPDLQDPRPQSRGGADARNTLYNGPPHRSDPAFDTAEWMRDLPGNLRVSYILPSSGLTVTGAGVFWPAPDDPLAVLLGDDGQAAGPHRLVWVDLVLQGTP